MAGVDLAFSCRCGTLKGVLHSVSPTTGSHVKCYCCDCQAAAHHLGAVEVLDEHGGTEIYQTIPAEIELTEGAEKLACMRLSPKGLMRWYASCCNSPLFNTLASAKLAFVGVHVRACEKNAEAFGPLVAVVNTGGAIDPPENLKDFGMRRAIWGFVRRNLGAKLRGRTENFFFDANRNPIVTPYVLTLEERRAATPK